MYKVYLAIHVLTTVFLIGPLVHVATTSARGLRNADANATAAAARSATIYTFLSTVVVIAGFGLMAAPSPWVDGPTARFLHPFIWMSIILWLIAVVTALVVLVPTLEKATRKLIADEPVEELVGRVASSGGVIAVLYFVIIVLMIVRPGG